ncbi:MAG TPA: enolase C-terminal domain-like protein [Propionicimonas sp.]|nr:enolase C-terminal domain-like protein [Propionicimonas sp.]
MARIVQVATARMARPLHTPFVTALRRTEHVFSVVVRVTDADGRVGFGEAPQIWRVTGESQASIEACVRGPLAGVLLERDPMLEPAADVHANLADAVVANGGARAATEIAVQDLLARAAGVPLARFLGGAARPVGTDVTIAAQGPAWDPKGPAASTFNQVKIKVGLDPSDVDRVIEIHRTATRPVRVDVNQAWDLATATSAVEAWLAAGVRLEFLEQPLPAWDLAGHAELRKRVPVPIVLDESVFTIHDLRRAIDAGSGDIVNIKLAKCGGLHAGLELASLAADAGLGLMVGSMMESELGLSAAAALASTLAPDQVHDLDAAWWSIDPMSDPGTPYRDGTFLIDDSPGLSHAVARVGGAELTFGEESAPG